LEESRSSTRNQKEENKMSKLKFGLLTCIFLLISCFALAQEFPSSKKLLQEVIAAKEPKDVFVLLEQDKEVYFKDGRFNEFCLLLNDISAKKKSLKPHLSYFSSLSRYQQLKYLEEKQLWEEYFNKGNDYRQEITSGLDEVIKNTAEASPLQLSARLLLWQFHREQQDVLAGDSLKSLLDAVKVYAAADSSEAAFLKEAADKLLMDGQKGQAGEVYKLYIDKLIKADLKNEELLGLAESLFKDGNLEFAQTVDDVYIDRIIRDKVKDAAAQLARIAGNFVENSETANDPVYAEKVFQKIEEVFGQEAFNEKLLYQRAYNLENSGEFQPAKTVYINLLARFPKTVYSEKINFKLGIISAYALRDIAGGREYFQKLSGKETASQEVISSLYHLGLLAQWEEDLERAKANYFKLKEKAGTEFKSIQIMAEERLKEIEENKLLDSNIRIFLDVSLKEEYSSFNMSKLKLKSSVYNFKKDQDFILTASAYPPESGCLPLILEYVWIGDSGKFKPALDNTSFTSSYSESGTKFIGLVVRTSSGVIDHAIILLDVE